MQQFITVPTDKGHPVTHPVLLTDVEIGRVTALDYLFYKLQSNTTLEQVDVGHRRHRPVAADRPGEPRDVPGRGGRQDRGAAAPRLHGAGHPLRCGHRRDLPGTPAYPVLNVGDVVTAVDGTPTPTADALITTLASVPLRDRPSTLTVRKGGTGATRPGVRSP